MGWNVNVCITNKGHTIAIPNVPSSSTDEFCPNCGDWKPLDEVTGFCFACTRGQNPELLVCENCQLEFKPDNQFRRKCQPCRIASSKERMANAIEAFMALGLTYDEARTKVVREARPICLSCGTRITGGTRGRHFFCRSNKKCKTAGRRYKWYREYHRMSKPEAIAKVLDTLTGKAAQ